MLAITATRAGIPAPVIMNWDGAILHEPSGRLILYVQEIQREYERTNLFTLGRT